MSEDRSRLNRDDREGPGKDVEPERAGQAKLLAGRIACVVGIVLAVGAILAAIFGAGASISAGAVGIVLGALGYFLGVRRLGTFTVILSIAALVFGLAASQGLIPGLEGYDRDLPAREPRAE